MTHEEYNIKLRLVEDINPGEVLLPSLRKGYTRVNVIYMDAALKRLPAVKAPAQPKEKSHVKPEKPVDQTLRDLWATRTRLFGEMNKMSNAFHDCTTDAQRAENSRAILKKWDEILDVKRQISQYETTGEVTMGVSGEEYPLPDDPVELMKKLSSIRVMISQVQKALRDAGELQDEHPEKAARVSDGEKRLEYLKRYKGHAEQKTRQNIHD